MKSDGANTFGKIIQDASETKGFPLRHVAEALSVAKSTLWRWEYSEINVDTRWLVDIASAYDLSVSSMFEGKTLTAPTLTIFNRLRAVVESIEWITLQLFIRPKPQAVRSAVVAVSRLRVPMVSSSAFGPSCIAMASRALGQQS